MIDPVLAIFLRKELRDIRRNPQVIPGYVLLPVIAIALPAIFVAVVPTAMGPGIDPDFVSLLRLATRDPQLSRFPESERLARLIVRELGAFFLLMPVLLASLSAAISIAGEKQQRTLEPILATPMSDRELLVAKLIASVLPGMVVTWGAAVVHAVVIGIVSAIRFGHPILPGIGFLVSVGLLAPAAAVAAALVGMRASIRAVDTQTAVQTATLWVRPIAIAVIGLAGRIAVRSALGGVLAAVVVGAAGAWIFRGNLARFEREEILTRWK